MSAPSVNRLIAEHKGFIFHYLISLGVALTLFSFVLHMATYSRLPGAPTDTSQDPAEAKASFVRQQEEVYEKMFPKRPEDDGFDAVKDRQANLSPAQWKELDSLLHSMPDTRRKLLLLSSLADSRSKSLMRHAQFVFNHSNQLSNQLISDWNTFSKINIEVIYDMPNQTLPIDGWRQGFLSETLTVKDVCEIIAEYERYRRTMSEVVESTTLADRIIPELLQAEAGSDDAPKADPFHISPVVKPKLTYDGDEMVPAELPPISLTRPVVIEQMKKPPMSEGANSAIRARG